MSLSTEILNYINALKWPVVIAGGVYYFRKPFVHILERISTAEKGAITGPAGTGMSWDNTLKEVDAALDEAQRQVPAIERAEAEKESDEQPAASVLGFPPQIPYWPGLEDLAHDSPQSAVVLAFTQLEQLLRAAAEKKKIEGADRMGAIQLSHRLELPRDAQQALGRLAELRNAVIHHNAEPDENMAVEYLHSAARLYEYVTIYMELSSD